MLRIECCPTTQRITKRQSLNWEDFPGHFADYYSIVSCSAISRAYESISRVRQCNCTRHWDALRLT
jgi:hypothetical protein